LFISIMAKTTKTPKTNSKTNGTLSEPLKPTLAKTEPVKSVTAKAESAKLSTSLTEPAKPAAQPTISLEFIRPGAKQVAVAGSFNDWKPERGAMIQISNGKWVSDLNVKPGRHEYLFVVDGQWVPDPNARETVQNPFGGKNSVLTVSV
jgi:1,4-alpha-glucan branching enzyme